MAAARRADGEWTDSEIARSFDRVEQSLRQILVKIDLHPQMYPTRNEWDQRLATTDKRFEDLDDDLDDIRGDLAEVKRYIHAAGGRVVQVITPIIAGLALVIAIFRGSGT